MRIRGALLLALGLLLCGQVSSAQMDPNLARLLSDLKPDDQVNIIIDIKDKVDASSIKDSTIPGSHSDLIEALKQKTLETQAPVLSVLKKHGVTKIKQFWLSNKIATTVPASLILELQALPAIGLLSLDAPVKESAQDYRDSNQRGGVFAQADVEISLSTLCLLST